jgi:hypothetical protein
VIIDSQIAKSAQKGALRSIRSGSSEGKKMVGPTSSVANRPD